jgi:rod shape-determining protein MreC
VSPPGLKRRILDYSLAAILLALPLVVLRAGLKEPEELGGFDRGVLRVSSPLQAAVSWVVEGLGGIWNRYVWLVDVEEENRELRAANKRLREELAVARRLAVDTQQLEELIQLRRRTEAETVGARVVSSSVNPHLRVVRLRLDRGEGEVDVGMPVIDGTGLVGVIRRVVGPYSDVLLLTDPETSVEVVAPRTGARGTVTGLSRADAYRCKLRVDKRGGVVEVGDLVVTKDLGAFPGGIEVGVVSELSTVDYSLYQEVEIEPSVDFASLGRVLVVVSPPPPPDPDAERSRASAPARKVGSF